MKLCQDCEVVIKDGIVMVGDDCPISGCEGTIIDVDENLVTVISLLKSKGFFIDESYCGHSYETLWTSTRISFCEDYNFPNFPEGFGVYRRRRGNGMELFIIKHFQHCSSRAQLQRDIMDSVIKLLDWAEQLPMFDEID